MADENATKTGPERVVKVVRSYLRSTSKRSFVAIPIMVLIEQAVSRRKLHAIGLPLMAWGYLQYRFGGRYRNRIGGGGPGVSGPPPARVCSSGIYRVTRNPMYTGHLIYLTGLTLLTRSPFSGAVTVGLVPWFRNRIIEDERRLIPILGEDYVEYLQRVPRWGSPSSLRAAIASGFAPAVTRPPGS